MDYAELKQAVGQHAAIRRRQRLQPVGGPGDKVFPPTYPASDFLKRILGERNTPPRHVYEQRQINGEPIWCTLLDSVQSQANRLEEALLSAMSNGIHIPHVVVDFSKAGLTNVPNITSLDAPHRVFDAILRDSLLADEPFMDSPGGRRLAEARPENASAVLEISPTALLFGSWHSTGQGGGLGARFTRCLASELVAINTPVIIIKDDRFQTQEPLTTANRTGSRIDPLGILNKVKIYQAKGNPNDWTAREDAAATAGANKEPILYTGKGKKGQTGRPSLINHGNVTPTVQPLGITCDYIEHTLVLSFAGLRRLHFGSTEKNAAGRTLLAALGLLAVAEQDACGYALRSRCDLVCEGRAPLELVHPDGEIEKIGLDRAAAHALYANAMEAAYRAGFAFPAEPIRLTPQEKLVEIIRRSQELALRREGGEEDAAGPNS